MPYETVVALNVTDEAGYARYREAMAPLLAAHGGGFRYDFAVARALQSASAHPINRVFAIYFADRARMDAFFAHPEYQAIRARHFAPAVEGVTILGGYERP